MEVVGIIKVLKEKVIVSDKFCRKDVIVTIDPQSQYPQDIIFQTSQSKVGISDAFYVGDEVRVHYNLKGKCYEKHGQEDKYFNTLEAWRIDLVSRQ